jgi:membrane associated rhomboid family serine protease
MQRSVRGIEFAIETLLPYFRQVLNAQQTPYATITLASSAILAFFADPDPRATNLLIKAVTDVRVGALNPSKIVLGGRAQLYRLISSGFLHADETHLVYNMVSLLSKGLTLEPIFGSRKYFIICMSLLAGSHAIYVFFAYIQARFGSTDLFYSNAIGISALLFALKVLASSREIVRNAPAYSNFMGMRLPSSYVAWAELVLISIITPQASFTGHLCGIVSGLIFLFLYRSRSLLALLKYLRLVISSRLGIRLR